MQAPTNNHLMAAKRVLRYLCGTYTRGLYFDAHNTVTLRAFSYADWGGDQDDYISTGANLVYLASILSPGLHKNRNQWLDHLQRRNTSMLLLQPLRFNGFNRFFKNLVQPTFVLI